MRKTLILLSLLIGMAAYGQGLTSTGCVMFAWSAPTNGLPDLYVLHHHTNMAIPLIEWPTIATTPGTSTNAEINILPGAHFFFLTASNAWGESLPSNVLGTAVLLDPPSVRLTWYGITNVP